jgi:tRNA nucleotidyltransferase (CCA-adding enzyme)
MTWKFYTVGGTVRDELLGIKPKDLDLVAIGGTFSELEQEVIRRGGKIFVSKPEYATVRCTLPDVGPCDLALARKDGEYSDGRHPDSVSLADTLAEDLARRDFTIGAMAKDIETGEIIDLFGGKEDLLVNKVIRCVGNPLERFNEDRLRVFRAIRFAVTKNLNIDWNTKSAMNQFQQEDFKATSTERIREELNRMFAADTFRSVVFLGRFPVIEEVMQERGIWLKPTVEKI